MDEKSIQLLEKVGIILTPDKNNEILISRDVLLSDILYNSIKDLIPDLKKIYSSSSLTSLHKKADIEQKWPLLNLVRQILHVYGFQMKPIRKSNGYTAEGIKKFKRFFLINKCN